MAALCVFAGVGAVYLLRSARLLDVGPNIRDALPLEQLAASDSQPLLRVLVAWAAAGISAGLVLGALTRARPAACALGAATLAVVLLVLTGAASEAVESSLAFAPRLAPQVGQPALWVAAGLMLVVSYPAARATRSEA